MKFDIKNPIHRMLSRGSYGACGELTYDFEKERYVKRNMKKITVVLGDKYKGDSIGQIK